MHSENCSGANTFMNNAYISLVGYRHYFYDFWEVCSVSVSFVLVFLLLTPSLQHVLIFAVRGVCDGGSLIYDDCGGGGCSSSGGDGEGVLFCDSNIRSHRRVLRTHFCPSSSTFNIPNVRYKQNRAGLAPDG